MVSEVIYVRVSTDEQVKKGHGIQSQERECRKLAESKGIKNPRVIKDEGGSGRNLNREGLQKILDLARGGKIDRVLVWKLDRLSRDMLDTFYILRKFKKNGTSVETPEGKIDFDNPINLLITAVRAYGAEDEVRKLVERTQGGKREKFREKKWIHSYVPFGYVRKDDWLSVNWGEVKIFREIFRIFLRCRRYAGTASEINERFGKDFTRAQIKSILTNPVYIGRPKYGDVQVEDDSLAVIDEEDFDEVQEIVEEIASKYSEKGDEYLDDKIREYGFDYVSRTTSIQPICKKCHRPMVKAGSKTVRGHAVRKYKCRECGHQTTVPLGAELAELEGRKLLSCPYCRVTENFYLNKTVYGQYEYRCKTCGGTFISRAKPDKFLRDYPPNKGGQDDR